MSDLLSSDDHPPEEDEAATESPSSRRLLRLVGGIFVGIALVLGVYLLVGYFGWQSGQQLLLENQQTQLREQLEKQVDLAQGDIERESYALAIRRLEWVLERSPNFAEAQTLLLKAQIALSDVLTPEIPPTVAPTPAPTPTPGVISDPADELDRISQLIKTEQWSEAISALTSFQLQFPNHERQQTNKYLYDANIGLGMSLIEGEQAELGLFYLTQARQLGDLPQEVEDYRIWAELYLQGIAYYGVNWGVALGFFYDLCAAAPFYQSSCDLLYESLVSYGDQYAYIEDWCPAEELYREARLYDSDESLNQKLGEAREGCLTATPTPSVLTNTVPLTETTEDRQ